MLSVRYDYSVIFTKRGLELKTVGWWPHFGLCEFQFCFNWVFAASATWRIDISQRD